MLTFSQGCSSPEGKSQGFGPDVTIEVATQLVDCVHNGFFLPVTPKKIVCLP